MPFCSVGLDGSVSGELESEHRPSRAIGYLENNGNGREAIGKLGRIMDN
jgi:hypothetical protein